MSVILIDANKNGKYEFTKDELQKLLDRVEQEAFERGMSCGRRMQEPKEKEYVYLNSPLFTQDPLNPYDTNWNKVTCESTVTDPRTVRTSPTDATCKSTCIGTDPMDIN